MSNLSINSYNIFYSVLSGVNVYDLSGNELGIIELPGGHGPIVTSSGYTQGLIYEEHFSDVSSGDKWEEVVVVGDGYDFTEGFMRNNNNSSTPSESVTYESYTALADFDIKIKMMQGYSGGSKTDGFMYFFNDQRYSPTGPYLFTKLQAYAGGAPYNDYEFRLYDAAGSTLYYLELTKYDYRNELGTWYWGRIKREGDTFYFKHWKETESEPGSWDGTTTQSGLGIFSGPLYAWSRTGSTGIGCGYDDITIEADVLVFEYEYNDTKTVYADDTYMYVGTSLSGVYVALASGVLSNPLVPYKYDTDITNNNVNYIHGAGDYLCVSTVAGVDRYNVVSGTRIYTTKENIHKCFQTTSGTLYYAENNIFPSVDESPAGIDGSLRTWKYYQNLYFSATTIPNENVRVYFSSGFPYQHANLDGSDIRFLDDAGNNLPYYIETWYPSASILVKVPEIGTSNFYMIYGKSDATAQSSTDAYYFSDDFTTIDTNVWQINLGHSSSYITTNGEYATIYDYYNLGTDMVTKDPIPYNLYITTRMRRRSINNQEMDFAGGYSASLTNPSTANRRGYVYIGNNYGNDTPHLLAPYWTGVENGTKWFSTSWREWEFTIGEGYAMSYYNGETLEATPSGITDPSNYFFYHINNYRQNYLDIDWVRMRTLPEKIVYTSTENLLFEFIKPRLHVMYNPTTNWTTPDYTYTDFYGRPLLINDIHITEETSSYNDDNTIFLATDRGAHVIEERQGNEENANVKRYYIR